MKRAPSLLTFVLVLGLTVTARGGGPLEDPTLERFVGTWRGEGVAIGPAGEELAYEDRLEVEWSVGHTWLAMDLSVVRGAAAYEARGFLTRSPGARPRYELVWIDPDRRATVARGEVEAGSLVLRAEDAAGATVVTTYRFVAADRLDMTLELEDGDERSRLLRVSYRRGA